ncbi:hypothetical protein Mal33_13860 [Rosistilla oblonga]|uniref:Uncharacterized protein n=2 Tax=Rosistilla oblonga TaxID=2527990 RepID=A0A518IQQ1_9BACT|nr:hypothetical protein Mal33_13860 [Rosistilla oblonga]
MPNPQPSAAGLGGHAMLQRPALHLDALSIEMKWETTRRHPLYVWLWNTWRVFQREHQDQAATEFQDFAGTQWAWGMLGINGIPVDPALMFEELSGANANPRWLKRSARPVTYRHLAKILQARLSSDGLRLLSTMLFKAGETEPNSDERDQRLVSLNNIDCPELDCLVDLPLLQYSPAAPSKEFVSDITNLRNEMRSNLGIEESRTNESKMRIYLDAWDAREGWRDGTYDRSAPMSLKNASLELETSQRKAKYAYQQGFQLISGHPFSFENWMRLIGTLHLSGLDSGDVGPVALARLRHPPSVRGIDDTTLSSSDANSGASVLENISGSECRFDEVAAIDSIKAMIQSGHTNDQILAELELEALAEPAIDELRSIIEMEGS